MFGNCNCLNGFRYVLTFFKTRISSMIFSVLFSSKCMGNTCSTFSSTFDDIKRIVCNERLKMFKNVSFCPWSTERCFKSYIYSVFVLARWETRNNPHILSFWLISARKNLILSQKLWKIAHFCQFSISSQSLNTLFWKKFKHI